MTGSSFNAAILLDPAAAEHDVAIVKHGALTGRDSALRLIEDYLDARIRCCRGEQGSGGSGVLVANLHPSTDRSRDARDRDPVDVLREEACPQEIVVAADRDTLRERVG